MPKNAKRRFVGLDTEEVSLVDSPANEVEFLVVKNTEDQRMSATAAKKQRVQVEVDDDETQNSDVAKALEHVNGIVEKITTLVAKSGGEKQAPAEGGESTEGGDEGGDADDAQETDTEKATKSLKAVLSKCGMDAEMAKKVYGSLKAAGFDLSAKAGKAAPPFPPPKGGKKTEDDDEEKKTTKSNDGDEGDEPLTMANLSRAVQKAAAFTPARIAQLQSAQQTLKLILEAVTPGTSPDANTPAVSSHGNASGVSDLTKPNTKPSVPTMKSADPELVTAIKNLAGVVDGLVERVTSIEKARPGSNSLAEQGGTDSNVKKSSMWSGVL